MNKPQSSTHSGRNRRQRLSPDTKPLFTYEAELFWALRHRATVKIKAHSLEEAERNASGLGFEGVEHWEPFGVDMTVDSVQLADGGSDDE
jgi:hypothetical protein